MSITMAQLASKFAKAAGKVNPLVEKQLQVVAQVGVGYMKREIQEMHAVDTGTMLNSTTAEKAGATNYLIGPTVNYAAFVALGTSHMVARPFHTVAAQRLQLAIDEDQFNLKNLGL